MSGEPLQLGQPIFDERYIDIEFLKAREIGKIPLVLRVRHMRRRIKNWFDRVTWKFRS